MKNHSWHPHILYQSFGIVCGAEIAGEIGTTARFNSESGLAIYLGMAPVDNSSGNYKGTKSSRHVNKRAKAAMMVVVGQHIRKVNESKAYYEKKLLRGKRTTKHCDPWVVI